MKALIFIFLTFILVNGADLKKSGDFVIDKHNGLMWQDSKDNINVLVSHIKAPAYCSQLTAGGHSDWRLPSVDEYKTIIDKNREDQIAINRAFIFILPDDYWTNDRRWQNFGRWGYYIFFKSGTAYYENRTYKKLVRCVRNIGSK